MANYILYMSLRSPYARRVRLVLEELKEAYSTEVADVFNPSAALLEANPLGRVPALKLPDGQVLIDSYNIQDYLREKHSTHSLYAAGGASLVRLRSLTALATGMMDYSIQAYLERQRPPGLQSQDAIAEGYEVVHRALKSVEHQIAGSYLLGDRLTVWDLDLGSALAYSDLRIGKDVVDRYSPLRQYLARLNELPSFQKTVPPA